MNKKFVSLILVLVMLTSSLPVLSDKLDFDENEDAPITDITLSEDADYEEQTLTDSVSVSPLADGTIDLSAADCTLGNGTYTLTGDGSTEFTHSIIVPALVKAELTITNVSIRTAASPIRLDAGAELILHIEGINTLTATAINNAGIAVIATADTAASLTIDGDGTLNVTGAQNGAGIGSNMCSTTTAPMHGNITINSGTITATGGIASAGIGSGRNCPPSSAAKVYEIQINGGIVTAIGGTQAAGIGGAQSRRSANITINGGFVTAVHGTGGTKAASDIGTGAGTPQGPEGNITVNGGSITTTNGAEATFSKTPVTSEDKALTRRVTLTMPSAADAAGKEVEINGAATFTDNNSKLYVYITDDTKSITVAYNSKQYYTAIDSENTDYTLEEFTGSGCSCTAQTAAVSINTEKSILVNKIEKTARVRIETVFTPSDDCEYIDHSITTAYTITDTEGNAVEASVASISGGYLTVAYFDDVYTIRVSVTAVMNGISFTDTEDITVTNDDTARFDLKDGSVVINAGSDADTLSVTWGTANYTVAKDTRIEIWQSSLSTTNTITANTTASIKLENVNIQPIMGSAINMPGESASLDILLDGENKIGSRYSSAISGNALASTLTLSGDGSLTAVSGSGEGLGSVKALTINSGTITATGGSGGAGISAGTVTINGGTVTATGADNRVNDETPPTAGGAGIGGSVDGNGGCTVVITGGIVTATGALNAAGIGGASGTGNDGKGGTVTIKGGFVTAKSMGNGMGIGNGGNVSSPGTVKVDGGSVNAKLGSRPNNGRAQYLVTVSIEDILTGTDVTYSSVLAAEISSDPDDHGNEIGTYTDTAGKLYLYLNAGKQWVRVFKDGVTYYRYVTIAANDSNAITCRKNTVSDLTSFKIAGQTGEAVIDKDNLTVTVPVRHNIDTDCITPITTFEGAETDPEQGEAVQFTKNANGKYTAEYSVIGDDILAKKDYTVILDIQPDTAAAQDEYDISEGDISIYGDYVEFGGTRYKTNENGYVVTGTATTHSLRLEYSDTGALPPVTLKRLDISLLSGTPIAIHSSADITIADYCRIYSADSTAMALSKYTDDININISGASTSTLTVTGGNSFGALSIDADCSVTVTGVSSSFIGGMGANALTGSGKFFTDSETFMKITSLLTPAIQPLLASDKTTPLYQVSAHIAADNTDAATAVYNGKEYRLGDDRTLCLMLENGEYNMNVTYDDETYTGDFTIANTKAELNLKLAGLTGVEYYVDGVLQTGNITLPYTGGTVTFKGLGNIPENGIYLVLESDSSDFETIQRVFEKDEHGDYTIAIDFDENTYDKKDVIYTVSSLRKGIKTPLQYTITIPPDKSRCTLTQFELEGQVKSEITTASTPDGENFVIVHMPYDHEFKPRYAASAIKFTGGGSVSPGVGDLAPVGGSISGLYKTAYYKVTALDKTEREYAVYIYKETTPNITALDFTNPQTSDGGEVTVTIRGTSLKNIQNAEDTEKRKVYIYSDDGIDPVEAVCVQNGTSVTYTAKLTIPPNTSDTANKTYTLKARIGDVEQTAVNNKNILLTVPRKSNSNAKIKSFTVENQISSEITETETGNIINVVVPYDKDITNIRPMVVLEYMHARYTPQTEQDFTNDVTYTVTAEDNVTKASYTAHVEKEPAPSASAIQFDDPRYSSAGRVFVTVTGANLDNAAHAVGNKRIDVKATSVTGTSSSITATAAKDEETGEYVAVLNIPANEAESEFKYKLSVDIGGVTQTLSMNSSDLILTVPAKEPNSKDLTDVIITEGQSALIQTGVNSFVVTVPYNTDLRSVTPTVRHTGADYSPKNPVNFENRNKVDFTVTADDGTTAVYTVEAIRSGSPRMSEFKFSEPVSYHDTELNVLVTGQFIPYPNAPSKDTTLDTVKVWATERDGSGTVNGTVTYDDSVYGGIANAKVILPDNLSGADKIYDLHISVNNAEQNLGFDGVIVLPRRKTYEITGFNVNGQVGSTEITTDDVHGSTIRFKMPYGADITSLLPYVVYDGDDYTPKGAMDFDDGKEVPYTVFANHDEQRTYIATAERSGTPRIKTITVQDEPVNFNGSTVKLHISGEFFKDMEVMAIAADGSETITGVVDKENWRKYEADAQITFDKNLTHEDKVYTILFKIDGFEDDELIYDVQHKQITVPRRKTKAITSFLVPNLSDSPNAVTIGEDAIRVKVKYETDLTSITPTLAIDANRYEPTGAVNFDNASRSAEFRVYADADGDTEYRTYTVYLVRDGDPEIDSVTKTSPPNFNGGNVTVNVKGVFFESVKITAEPSNGGRSVEAMLTKDDAGFNEGNAVLTLNIPKNDSYEPVQYNLKFELDNRNIPLTSRQIITVPRRTSRTVTEYTLTGVQEGETTIQGTDIYVEVPYHLDISNVTPQMVYDADNIQASGTDFSNPERPVQYTLSSAGDKSVTYTVHVRRIGKDPKLNSFTVEGQVGDTIVEEDNISLVLASNTNLAAVQPVLEYDGDDYEPKEPQDFNNSKNVPVEYIISNKYGISHTYYVTITKKGGGIGVLHSDPTPKPSPTPTPDIEPTAAPAQTQSPKNVPYINGYNEDKGLLFKPLNSITRAEAAKILATLDDEFDSSAKYTSKVRDIDPDLWYANYMHYAIQKGYIKGYEDGTCRPDNPITRAEFASILARHLGADTKTVTSNFSDVSDKFWYYGCINALADLKIVSGYRGTFRPEAKLNRAEAVAIINRSGGRVMTEEQRSTAKCPFKDVTKDYWGYDDVVLAACEF